MERPQENQRSCLTPCPGTPAGASARTPAADAAGRYRCAELETELALADAGGVLYGAFSGFLGQGRMEMLDPIGPDVWALPCPRALDHTPPGDWSLVLKRGQAGRVEGIEVGCWLARRLSYQRVG
jgi:D-aminopeptidase